MKILKRIGKYALKKFEEVGKTINQTPDRNIKVPQSPLYHENKHIKIIRGGNPVVERITLPNHRRDRKPKGPAHSDTRIFNHPRG